MVKKLKKTTEIDSKYAIDTTTNDGASQQNDQSSDDGFSDKEDDVAQPANKAQYQPKVPRKRKQTSELIQEGLTNAAKQKKPLEKIKPPTLEEITELKETRNLFHSNLFRLQVKEMLAELKVKDKYGNFVNTWLQNFTNFVAQLESENEKQNIDGGALPTCLKKSPIKVPFALEHFQVQKQKSFQFQFIKPKTAPLLIGSAATKTLLSTNIVVDIAIVMPEEYFQKENYLNLVYDQKRAFYLSYIASKMLECKELHCNSMDLLKFNFHANNPLKPVLEISLPPSAGSVAKKLKLRLFVVAEESTFKLSRFVPWNNNIRSTLLGEEEDDESALPLATPNYNASVLFDLTMVRNHQLLLETFETHKNFQEGLILLKVWLQQRQLNIGYSGFHSHILAMFIVYLFRERKLHANMSSYQVARNVWNQLACSNWSENLKGITLCAKTEPAVPNQPTLEQFHANYDVVFIDPTGFYNICANLSLEVYERVRLEAKKAVDILNDMKLNSFQIIFIHKAPIYSQFDHILKINKAEVLEQILEMHSNPADRCNFIGNSHPQLLKIFTKLLRKGLDKRIHCIMPIEQPATAWQANEKPLKLPEYLHLGLIINPEHAYDVVHKGPESIAVGAEEFRKFWGERAQLRRFQDGSIVESVVWGTYKDPLSKKRLVVREIACYLLNHHLQVERKDIEYLAGQFDPAFKLTPIFKTDKLYEKHRVEQDTDAEALALKVIHSFDELSRKLHGLAELPLEIVGIGGIDAVFRYCEPEPIVQQARCIEERFYANRVMRGVIQLGTSGKWPEELTALRSLKVAFYIQIAKLLRSKFHYRINVTLDGLLILKDGYVFGLEIAHPKEVALLKKETESGKILKYVDSEASIALEKRHYIMPKITGALHGLYQMHHSFGPTVMIAKRWLYSQLIDDGLWPDECTELLIASQYVRTNAQEIPSQPQTGFLRFLQLLAFTDWQTELFLIDFNNVMNETTKSDLENRFHTDRSSFPPLCIATPYDLEHYGLVWTSSARPNVNILARVTLLARQALTVLETNIASYEELNFIEPSELFTACTKGYDLVIQLKPDLVPNSLAMEFSSIFAKIAKPNFRLPAAGTNYLLSAMEKLREAYSDYAAFFYNPCGGKEIFVIWKPNIFGEKDFKVADVNGCNLNADGSKVHCDRNVLIEDFKIILKDFYLRIDTVDVISKLSEESAKQYRAIKAELKTTLPLPAIKREEDDTKTNKKVENGFNKVKKGQTIFFAHKKAQQGESKKSQQTFPAYKKGKRDFATNKNFNKKLNQKLPKTKSLKNNNIKKNVKIGKSK